MKIVYVAEAATPDAWSARGYEAALKIIDSRNPNLAENTAGQPGVYRHGWGVHAPDDDHSRVLAATRVEIDRLGLSSYGLDLESGLGWDYDGNVHGWGPEADEAELARVAALSQRLLTAAQAALPVPLWVSCDAHKLFPYRVWLDRCEFVTVQLYGERDPLPDAAVAWSDFLEQCCGAYAVPARPSTPLPVPYWAWLLLEWRNRGRQGPRPKTAPASVPAWFWGWASWRNARAAQAVAAGKAVPSLWAGQSSPRPDACVRFDAEIMQPNHYL